MQAISPHIEIRFAEEGRRFEEDILEDVEDWEHVDNRSLMSVEIAVVDFRLLGVGVGVEIVSLFLNIRLIL